MLSFLFDYSKWHYSYALLTILKLMKEFIRFFLNLFSVSLFLRTLFSPLFSTPINLKSAQDGTDTFSLIVAGVIIRIVGALFRLVLISIGTLMSILSFLFFLGVFIIWLCMPIVLVLGVFSLFTLYI